MNLLALDTSTSVAAVVVCRADGAVFAAPPGPAMRHGRRLIPTVRDLLTAAGLRTAHLDGIVVGLGPGSFTGLRIGVMAAKTLAYAAAKPVLGFDSLELIARNAPPTARSIAVIADAQRGELFTADFAREAPGAALRRARPTGIERAMAWRERLAPGTVVVGPARSLIDLNDLGMDDVVDPGRDYPRADVLAGFARDAWAAGRRDDLWTLEPVYFRASAAEERRGPGSPGSLESARGNRTT